MSHNKKSNSIMVRYCLTFLIYSEVKRKMDEPIELLFAAFVNKKIDQMLDVVNAGTAYGSRTCGILHFLEGICSGINRILNHSICDTHTVTYNFIEIHNAPSFQR